MTRAGSLRSSWHSEKLRDHHCIVQHLTDITAVTDNYKEIRSVVLLYINMFIRRTELHFRVGILCLLWSNL